MSRILHNYIKNDKEWDFSERRAKGILTDERKRDTENEYFLMSDDDDIVYFLVRLNQDEDEEIMLADYMGLYGCTTARYWSVKNQKWSTV